MSFQALVQCSLQICSFRNIDIRTSGLYKLYITLKDFPGSASTSSFDAEPYFLSPEPIYKSSDGDRNRMGKSCIKDMHYLSHAFAIQYINDKIEIGDVCLYRIMIEAQTGLSSQPLLLDARLLFCPSPLRSQSYEPSDDQYLEVSKAQAQVLDPCKGVHQYLSLVFDDDHFSALGVILHTSIWNIEPDSLLVQEIGNLGIEFLVPQAKHLIRLHTLIKDVRNLVPEFDQEYRPTITQFIDFEEREKPDFLTEQTVTSFLFKSEYAGPSETMETFLIQMNTLSLAIYELIDMVLTLFQRHSEAILQYFQRDFERKNEQIFEGTIVRWLQTVDSVPLEGNKEMKKTHNLMCSELRSNIKSINSSLCFQNLDLCFESTDSYPIFFEDSYQSPSSEPLPVSVSEGVSLYVFVHGYKGSSMCLRALKNCIALHHSKNALFLCATSNEMDTEGDILEMGARLALEVRDYIQDCCPENLARLSFIGYSLGGLIIRSALPHLSMFQAKMHVLITLSTPHLGLEYSHSSLVDLGMWFVKSWNQSLSLNQLAMTDSSDLQNALLMKLCEFEGLDWFKNVLFFSSAQDNYAPAESARVEVSEKAGNGSDKGCLYIEMTSRLLAKIAPERLRRIDVNFVYPGGSVDSIIGRKAHLEFIENRLFFWILATKYGELFR